MVQTVGITEAILSLHDVQEKFQLSQTTDPQFFTEWFESLPEITDIEKESLNRLKHRFLYYVADGAITEGTINLIMVSPLLEIVRLFDPLLKLEERQALKLSWKMKI